jgi:hypothetical protein
MVATGIAARVALVSGGCPVPSANHDFDMTLPSSQRTT